MLRELPYIPNSVPGSTTDLARLNSGVSYSSGISERSGTPSHRRVVVYVDGQLRNSKRFDAEGMQRDYPHLFEPIQRRRSSSSNMSSPGLASSWGTNGFATPDHKRREEGQLRYWTADMCSNSPQLFDFVVTLGGDGTVLFTSWLL
jgi:NAD+ kinase